MPDEAEKRPKPPGPARKRLPAKPRNDGFVVFYVDGFAQLTPEQQTWPVVDFMRNRPKTDPPPPAEEPPPS